MLESTEILKLYPSPSLLLCYKITQQYIEYNYILKYILIVKDICYDKSYNWCIVTLMGQYLGHINKQKKHIVY